MGVGATTERFACHGRDAWSVALGALLLACGLGACVRAPALVVGARSTFGTADRRPVRVVMLCALDWSRAPDRAVTADPTGVENEPELELDASGTAASGCAVASLCEWEARARQAAVLQTLTGLPEAAP